MESTSRPFNSRRVTWLLAAALSAGFPAWAVADDPPKTPVPTDAQKERLKERDRLGEQSQKLQAQGKLPEAIAAADAMLAIQGEVLGESTDDAIAMRVRISRLHEARDDWTSAIASRRRVLELRIVSLGESHWKSIDARWALAKVKSVGDLDPAGRRRLVEVARASSEASKLVGEGRFREALDHGREAVAGYERTIGQDNPTYAQALNVIAICHRALGDLAAARACRERALGLIKSTLGDRHPEYAMTLADLAYLLISQGDYVTPGPLYENAASVLLAVDGGRGPSYAEVINQTGLLHRARGDLDQAQRLLERAVELFEVGDGGQGVGSARALDNLGIVLHHRGDLQGAKRCCGRALTILQARLGRRHPETLQCSSNLATIYWQNRDFSEARRLLEDALTGEARRTGGSTAADANNLLSLSAVLADQGEVEEARELIEKGLATSEKILGASHADHATNLRVAASTMHLMGDLAAARRLLLRALDALESTVAGTLPSLPEREQIALVRTVQTTLWAAMSVEPIGIEDENIYQHMISLKGLTLRPFARRPDLSPEVRDRIGRLNALRGELNRLYYASVPTDRGDEHASNLKRLSERREVLEGELARIVGGRSRALRPREVSGALPDGTAFVDILRYDSYTRSGPPTSGSLWRESRYTAFVVRRGAPPVRVDLGPSDRLDELIESWRGRLMREVESEEVGRRLAERVWVPLEPLLEGIRTVLISPDDATCFLPWGALPDRANGTILLRRYRFGVVSSAQQLVALAEDRPAPAVGGLLAVGGVDYEKAERNPGTPIEVAGASPPVFAPALDFGPLPGTAGEVEAVVGIFRAAHPGEAAHQNPTGARATKERLRSAMIGRRHLHLATHGYFAGPGFRSALSPRDNRHGLRSWEAIGRGEVSGYYPGLLSGLAWAGASRPPVDPNTGLADVGAGLMTAEEVGGLDLKGCELVVLSACETGLGRTAGGEGVLGLQRAFHQAGSRSVVASLWRVDDAASKELMTRFYTNLWERKLEKLEALRQAQLSILDDPNFGDGGNPGLWAAWTLSGDPGGLPKLDPPADTAPESKK